MPVLPWCLRSLPTNVDTFGLAPTVLVITYPCETLHLATETAGSNPTATAITRAFDSFPARQRPAVGLLFRAIVGRRPGSPQRKAGTQKRGSNRCGAETPGSPVGDLDDRPPIYDRSSERLSRNSSIKCARCSRLN